MNQDNQAGRRRVAARTAWVCVVMTVLAGCTPEKARAVRTAALKFRADAETAIRAVKGLMDAEIASPARSDAAKTEEFVKNILSLPKDVPLSSEAVELAADPYAVKLSPEEQAARNELVAKLQAQYGAFASIFDDLERGSFLAKDKLVETRRHGVKLTAQLAGLAKSFGENPPRLLQRRTALVTEMEATRDNATLSGDQKRQQLAELKESWDRIIADEAALQQGVVEKCLAAAASGQAVLEMIDSYEHLSLDELSRMGESMLTVGEQVSGKSLSGLKARNEMVLGYLNSKPEFKVLLEPAMNEAAGRIGAGLSKSK